MDFNIEEYSNLGINFFYGSIELLKILQNFKEKLLFRQGSSDEDNEAEQRANDVFQGYKFSILSILHIVIDQFVMYPNDIGIKQDEFILNAYNWGDYFDGSIHNLPRDSPHGIFLSNLLFLRKKIISSNDWSQIKVELYDLIDFLLKIENIILHNYVGKKRGHDQIIESTELISSKLPSVLLIFMNDSKKLSRAYYEMYRTPKKSKNKINLKKYTVKYGINPFDSKFELDEIDKHNLFLTGFTIVNYFLWKNILSEEMFEENKDIFNNLLQAKNWDEYDLLFGSINENVCIKLEKNDPLSEYYYSQVKEISNEFTRSLISPLNEVVFSKTNDLKSILHYRPISYVNYDSSGALNFISVLLGLVHAQKISYMKEKARVIELVHKDTPGNNFSYAIFLPCSGTISDSSRWWVFYRCATDYSGQGGFNHKSIHLFLERYEKLIEYEQFEIDEDDFKEYLKPNFLNYFETITKDAIDTNSSMRGAYLELLVSSYFWKLGYKVIPRKKIKSLNREIDVVAIDDKNKLIYFVECKEKSITVDEDERSRVTDELFEKHKDEHDGFFGFGVNEIIHSQLSDFIDLYNNVVTNFDSFLQELDITDKDYSLKGIFVTTDLLDIELLELPDPIEFWTFWILKEKLQSVKLDKSYLDILEMHIQSKIARPLKDRLFLSEYY